MPEFAAVRDQLLPLLEKPLDAATQMAQTAPIGTATTR
jgi:hypothetical protein